MNCWLKRGKPFPSQQHIGPDSKQLDYFMKDVTLTIPRRNKIGMKITKMV